MPWTNPQTGKESPELAYQVVELHDRHTPPVPDFASGKTQSDLREQFTHRRQNLILDREREQLRRESYSWVSPLIVGDKSAAPPTTPP
jgi:hypothetical protein